MSLGLLAAAHPTVPQSIPGACAITLNKLGRPALPSNGGAENQLQPLSNNNKNTAAPVCMARAQEESAQPLTCLRC